MIYRTDAGFVSEVFKVKHPLNPDGSSRQTIYEPVVFAAKVSPIYTATRIKNRNRVHACTFKDDAIRPKDGSAYKIYQPICHRVSSVFVNDLVAENLDAVDCPGCLWQLEHAGQR